MESFKLFDGPVRSHNLGQLNQGHLDQEVTLLGWVAKARDLGGLLFVDVRDRFGITQVIFDPQENPALHSQALTLRHEYVIATKGKVKLRPEGMRNKLMPTGEIEVHAQELTILNVADELPFQIEDKASNTSEMLKLKYRYLDLRRQELKQNILTRIKIVKNFRHALEQVGFLDIETPYLYKSTPEGAREFLVPSRIHPGEFYALPQSPQLFKQILMVAGFDRYYQIVKCFRDEDLRADRQPEFTQVDCEMSFVNQEAILTTFEQVAKMAMGEFVPGFDPSKAFPRMTFAEAMERYGNDKPDTRFGLELQDIGSFVKDSKFQVFQSALAQGGIVNALCLSGLGNDYSRKQTDELEAIAKKFGAKGLAWAKLTDDVAAPWQGPIAKFFSQEEISKLNHKLSAKSGDILFFAAGAYESTKAALSAVRLFLGQKHQLIDTNLFHFLWIVDFPLFERDGESGRLLARHHPFTSPLPQDMAMLESKPEAVRASAYDLVLNGNEIAGGSVRIHDVQLQRRVFERLGISDKEAEEKFGFLLEALRYGAPPHGGIAFGLDRVVMCMTKCDAIRDIIPFPKTQKATCLMTSSPAPVGDAQLKDVHVQVRKSTAGAAPLGVQNTSSPSSSDEKL